VIEIVYETHSISEDNERRIATGWNPGMLSSRGRELARDLGERRKSDGLAVVFASDLQRAAETARIAFEGTGIPIFLDWRLRECDYGDLNGTEAAALHRDRPKYLDVPHPGGESWRQAIERVGWFLEDLPLRWDGQRVLVIGHMAVYWGLEHWLNGVPLEELLAGPFAWQEGWEYRLGETGGSLGE
jgi:2,3-bisphosphoglycerate-dependent phosphoglycerate mutase